MKLFRGDTALLAALAGLGDGRQHGRQHGRLLRQTFPDDDGPADTLLLVNRLDAREGLSRDFRFTVEMLSDDASIDPTELMGKRVTIELVREDGTSRYFNGHVFEFRFIKTDGGFAFYDMVLGPWLAHLRLRQNNVGFYDLRVSDLTDRVFEDYVMRDWQLNVDYDPYVTYICQHNESDHNLLHRHWERMGWTYRYEHRADGHRLLLFDNTTDMPPIGDAPVEMVFQKEGGSSEDDGIHQWRPARRMGSAKTTVASFDFKNPRSARAESSSPNRQGDAPPDLEMYENTGTYGFRHPDEDGVTLARLRMEERDARVAQVEAESNDRRAVPGAMLTLRGHFSSERDEYARELAARREYLIVSAHHRASNNYEQGRGAASHYDNSFNCIESNIPWRPGRGFHSVEPRIFGVQTATVVGPPGEEIYTDRYGRVKVQFHWDRIGQRDGQGLPWVRVMSNWAGSGFGGVSLPRIGMEVVVQFLDGNLEHPLVIGCLYNERHMPPWELPRNKTQSGVLTRSSKQGLRSHANAFRFEDRKDNEEVWLHAEKDQRIEVEHDESHWVGNDRSKTVDHDETVRVKHDRNETVGHDETITVHNNRRERVDHDEHIDIGEHRSESVGGNEVVTIGGNRIESVQQTKVETVALAKALTVGGIYEVTVGAVMNTLVAASQFTTVLLDKTIKVAQSFHAEAGEAYEVKVGPASFTMTKDGRVAIVCSGLDIDASGPVRINGQDVDIN